MAKREGEERKRGPHKKRRVNLVPVVVDALAESEALPTDLRYVLELALPRIFEVNKADRHAYESEVVEQAEKALAIVQGALEQTHTTALTKQNEVIAPAEHATRTEAKKAAEAALEAAKATLEASRESHTTSRKAAHEAQAAVKAADKEAARAEKEMQAMTDKKNNLSELLTNEFVSLQESTSNTPAGKQAVKRLLAVGKEYSLDATLLQTLPLTCKKEPENRTEFETLMFTSLKAAIDRQIESITQKLVELEPGKAEKLAAVAAAKESLEKAEAAQTAVNTETSAAQAAAKAAEKEVTKADEYLYQVWADMKEACDVQDQLAKELRTFKDNILTAFGQLREKEPEAPEEPEPAEEEAAAEAAVPAEEVEAVAAEEA